MFAQKRAKHFKLSIKLDFIKRTKSFLELGNSIKNIEPMLLDEVIKKATSENPWFTEENIRLSMQGLLHFLEEDTMTAWINQYDLSRVPSKKIGVVMAGNIPMVGIHDMICVLVSGHTLIAKLSSQDEVLIPFIANKLIDIAPEFKDKIHFVDKLKGMDAVIATGSDNSSRYFNYYFSKYPHIIRKNRTSIAILNGKEKPNELKALGIDIFSYFGLGCRNVSKIYLPKGYEINVLIPHFEDFKHLTDHNKYSNNYYYNKSIFLVNNSDHLDCGFALFQQNSKLTSPISVVYYDYYSDIESLYEELIQLEQKIQCRVSNIEIIENRVKFGKAQMPDIWDYADNIDTMNFLINL